MRCCDLHERLHAPQPVFNLRLNAIARADFPFMGWDRTRERSVRDRFATARATVLSFAPWLRKAIYRESSAMVHPRAAVLVKHGGTPAEGTSSMPARTASWAEGREPF